MLDFRIQTFLTLCETMNYTKTAEKLNMTQPAVTQQIHFLEDMYGCKLFVYSGKTLSKTEKGLLLEQFAKSMRHNEQLISASMKAKSNRIMPLKIGATKTIGDYVISDKLSRYLSDNSKNVVLQVDNTIKLLKSLESGKLDFAIIEGPFDKTKYSFKLFSKENFVGICSVNHPFANKEINIEDLLEEDIITREKGSGTRDIFDQILHEYNYSLSNLKRVIQISNFSIIKDLVRKNIGISFVYECVSKNDDDIATFTIKDTSMIREFNYVYLKNTLVTNEFNTFYNI